MRLKDIIISLYVGNLSFLVRIDLENSFHTWSSASRNRPPALLESTHITLKLAGRSDPCKCTPFS